MKIGDVVKVGSCANFPDDFDVAPCECFFCESGSSRIGVVVDRGPSGGFQAMFDVGMWQLSQLDEINGDVTVISEDD